MPRTFTGPQVIKALQRLGFTRKRQSGSHVVMHGPRKQRVVVPDHGRTELKRGTLASILRQAGITQTDLEDAAS